MRKQTQQDAEVHGEREKRPKMHEEKKEIARKENLSSLHQDDRLSGFKGQRKKETEDYERERWPEEKK